MIRERYLISKNDLDKAHDAYAKDSKVTHNGKKWISSYDANVWEPGVYGWEEQSA